MFVDDPILITGGNGLLGTALVAALRQAKFSAVSAPGSTEVDLLDLQSTVALLERVQPKFVFHLAGAVFGLGGNLKDPSNTFLKNTLINTNVVEACRQVGVQKVLGMGSICAYPSILGSKQILHEENLFDGLPHPGELAYGQSKRSLLVHLEACHQSCGIDYAFVLSTNLYGPRDRFNIENGHVIPSLVRKFYLGTSERRPIKIWGDGSSKRDFMFSQDAAEALVLIMKKHRGPINLATGVMTSIGEVVSVLAKYTDTGELVSFDPEKPRGHEFRGFDVSKLRALGFATVGSVEQGLRATFDWYSENHAHARH